MSRAGDSSSRGTRLARELNRRLVDQLAAAQQRRRLTVGGVAIYLLATAVHAVTLGFIALGLWLGLAHDGWPLRVLGCLSLLVPFAVLPGLNRGRLPPALGASAPETAALLGEIAQVVGSPMPANVHISDDLNAFVTSRLLRGRALVIGAPLWVACSPQARVALLAHELGHLANHDLVHGRYVATAQHTLVGWYDIFSPGYYSGDAAVLMTHILCWPARMLIVGYLHLMSLANAASRRRQELYADLAAVGAAGTAGAVDMLETLLAADGLTTTANRVAVTTGRPPLRPALETYMAEYDAERRTRARHQGATEGSRIDDDHPPTAERLRLVESVEPAHAAVILGAARNDAIDRELAEVVDRNLTSFADLFRGH